MGTAVKDAPREEGWGRRGCVRGRVWGSQDGLGASSIYSQENGVSTRADRRVRGGGKLHSREGKEAPEEMEGTRI